MSITFNMICAELCPPPGASRLPGNPAVSQFEQMSISIVVQSTQWKSGPTMSCWQLHPHQKNDTEVLRKNTHLKHWTPGCLTIGKKRVWVSTDKKACIAATYAARPNCQTFERHRHSVFPSDCSIGKGALPGKDGSDGHCAPRWVQHCHIRKLISA